MKTCFVLKETRQTQVTGVATDRLLIVLSYRRLSEEVYSIAHGLPPPVPFSKDSGLDFSAYTGKSFGVESKCLV